jgi:hypothetical protein
MAEEPRVEQSSAGGNHNTKTGVGPSGNLPRLQAQGPSAVQALGAEVSVFPCVGDVALAMLAVRG